MARFSEAFLILKGQQAGLPPAQVPIVRVVMSVVYTLLSMPAGAWSDRVGRRAVLILGLGVLVAADVTLGSRQVCSACLSVSRCGAPIWD